MCGRHAAWGAVLVLTACATSGPAPEPADAPAAPAEATTAAAPTSQDSTAMAPGMGHMHRGGMAEGEGMGGMRHQGMQGQGRGMQGGGAEGQGMHGRREGGMGMGMGHMEPTEPLEVPAELQEGERIYKEICSVCHTMDPPANLAPPMSHVARHLHQSFDTEEAAVAHVVSYLPAPDAEASIMPEMARERFGLMPAQPLPRDLLEAVGRYVWFLGTPR